MEMHFENDDLILNGENIKEKITIPNISNNVSAYARLEKLEQNL